MSSVLRTTWISNFIGWLSSLVSSCPKKGKRSGNATPRARIVRALEIVLVSTLGSTTLGVHRNSNGIQRNSNVTPSDAGCWKPRPPPPPEEDFARTMSSLQSRNICWSMLFNAADLFLFFRPYPNSTDVSHSLSRRERERERERGARSRPAFRATRDLGHACAPPTRPARDRPLRSHLLETVVLTQNPNGIFNGRGGRARRRRPGT